MAHPIDILEIKPDKKLKLSDGGFTEVNSKLNEEQRTIIWKTKPKDSGVSSFRIVGKTKPDPFDDPIPPDFVQMVKLKVKKNHPDFEWEYCIEYKKPKDDTIYKHDPLIAINPRFAPGPIGFLLAIIFTFLGSFITTLFLRNKKE